MIEIFGKNLNALQVEYQFEKQRIDFDHALMNNVITQSEYNAAISRLETWANAQFDLIQN